MGLGFVLLRIMVVLWSRCYLIDGSGLFDVQETNPCDALPCQNGGTCRIYVVHRQCFCPPQWAGHSCEIESGHVGIVTNKTQTTEFIFAFPENYKGNEGPKVVIMSQKYNTTIDISVQRIEFFRTIVLRALTKTVVQLPVKALARGTGHQNVAILIQSSDDVIVYGINDNHVASGDGFLVLPTTSLGTEYYVVGAPARKRDSYRSEVAVVGTEDETRIGVYFTAPVLTSGGDYYYGWKFFTLNRLDAIQFQSSEDMTNSFIQSNKPISVISGSRCGFVHTEKPTIRKSCEHMVSHLPPVRHWGRQFVVTPLHESGGETIVRLVALRGAVVVIGGKESTDQPLFVGQGRFSEINLSGETPMFLHAFKPILVAAYVSNVVKKCQNKSRKACKGDGKNGHTLTLISPVEHYTTQAMFATFEVPGRDSNQQDYILNIVTTCKDRHQLMLNEQSLPQSSLETWKADTENADYCSLRLHVDDNPVTFHLQSLSPQAKFTATLVRNRPGTTIAVPVAGDNWISSDDLHENGDRAGPPFKAIHSGTDFIFGFINSCNCWTTLGPRVIIISDSAVAETIVNITALNGEFKKTIAVSPGASTSVKLPAEVIAVDAYIPRPPAAIHVVSSLPITVYGINDAYEDRSDGFLVRPTESLGTQHIAISSWGDPYGSTTESAGQILIIAVHDGTIVSLGRTGQENIRLNRLEAFSDKHNFGVLGVKIISNKPVSVITGIECGFSQSFDGKCFQCYFWPCDHMVEHLPPVSHMGYHFAVTSFEGYSGNGKTLIYVIAAHDRTTVSLPGKTFGSVLNTGESDYFYLEKDSLNSTVITSNHPITVAAMSGYGPLPNCNHNNITDECSSYARPVMTLIPPLKPLSGRAKFQFQDVREAYDMRNYAFIIADCSQSDKIFVNNKTIEATWRQEPIAYSNYCVYRLDMARVIYDISTTDDNIDLCAVQYGFSSRSGFAFPIIT